MLSKLGIYLFNEIVASCICTHTRAALEMLRWIVTRLVKPGAPAFGWHVPGFLKLFLSGKSVCVCVCVCVCPPPRALITTHVK